MANLTIDTTATAYTTMQTRFTQMKDAMRPMLRRYHGLLPDQKQAWRNSDPLLNDIITFCEKVTEESDV
jgi:hypothetical protein